MNLTGFMFSTNLSSNDHWPLIMKPSRNIYDLWLRINLTLVVYFVDFFYGKGAKSDVSTMLTLRTQLLRDVKIFETSTLQERGTTRHNFPSRRRGSVIQQYTLTLQKTWVLSYTAVSSSSLAYIWLRCLISYSADLTKFHENIEVSGTDQTGNEGMRIT